MRAVWIQVLLTLACLTWAALTHLGDRGHRAAGTGQVVFDCRPEEVSQVAVETPYYAHTAVRLGGADDPHFVFSSTRQRKEASGGTQPPVALPGAAASPGAAAVRKERFIANPAFNDYLTRLLPLRADRGVGVLTPGQEAEFGLERPAGALTVRCGQRTLTLQLGGRGFGSGRRYVRRARDGQVFLVAGALVQDMQSARYKFKRVSPFAVPLSQVDTVRVETGTATGVFARRGVSESGVAIWEPTEPATPGAPSGGAQAKRAAAVTHWLRQLSELRIRSYLSAAARPGEDLSDQVTSVTPVVAVSYVADGEALERFELTRVQAGGRSHYYGKSPATRGWVALVNRSAHRLAEELGPLLDIEGATAPQPAADPRTPGLPQNHPRLPSRYGGHGL